MLVGGWKAGDVVEMMRMLFCDEDEAAILRNHRWSFHDAPTQSFGP